MIPQAWQALWRPTAHAATSGLWDPRTVPICPTGHRNVHWWLVRIVRTADRMVVTGSADVPELVAAAVAAAPLNRAHHREVATARLALERWYAAGGLVRTLGDAGEWGEA